MKKFKRLALVLCILAILMNGCATSLQDEDSAVLVNASYYNEY